MTTRLPDLMTVYTENETRSLQGAQGVFEDVRCNLELAEDEAQVIRDGKKAPAAGYRVEVSRDFRDEIDLRGLMASQALKSVRVQNTEDETILDIYIHLLADVRIPDVVPEVQRSVKVAVQSMTGKPVTKVNVHVMGVTLPEESADRA